MYVDVLKRTKNTWKQEISGLDTDQDDLFLHLGFFFDGFRKYRESKSGSINALMVTILEALPTLRWKPGFNVIAPLVFLDATEAGTVKFINEQILPLYTHQLKDLSEGVEMFCGPLKKTSKVFAFTNCLIGDHPGRASFCNTLTSFYMTDF